MAHPQRADRGVGQHGCQWARSSLQDRPGGGTWTCFDRMEKALWEGAQAPGLAGWMRAWQSRGRERERVSQAREIEGRRRRVAPGHVLYGIVITSLLHLILPRVMLILSRFWPLERDCITNEISPSSQTPLHSFLNLSIYFRQWPKLSASVFSPVKWGK